MNKTEKLYYKDSYIKEFSAKVLEVSENADGTYSLVLDKTAFFPEEGGQTSDRGVIENAHVLDVSERAGVIYHKTDAPLPVGLTCRCLVNFSERFEKMQMHTAEHLVSGLIYSNYGINNVGFHLGDFEVTFDTSAPLTKAELEEIEKQANDAVFANVDIKTVIGSAEELSNYDFRSKGKEVEELRLVIIEGYDACACCAPHVNKTGEVGLIKFLSCDSHRGGSRIRMLAGARAYKFVSELYSSAQEISRELSVPVADIATETKKLNLEKSTLLEEISKKNLQKATLAVKHFSNEGENVVVVLENTDMDALRKFANEAGVSVSGTLVVLLPAERDFKYVIRRNDDVSEEIKKANSALSGRGGGRGVMGQGSFSATLADIEKHFGAVAQIF